MNKSSFLLTAGDTLVIALVTVIGFATHGEANTAVLPRMAATFLPLAFAWFLAAVLLRLFDPQTVSRPDQLWRPLAAIIFAGPLAALLRAFWLGSVVIPIFGLVLTGSAGLGMLAWRALWCWWSRSR